MSTSTTSEQRGLYRQPASPTIQDSVLKRQSPSNARDMIDEQFTAEELILRDHLALDRTRLANERTLLSYVRTALMLFGAGATAVKFVGVNPGVIVTGWVFMASGLIVGLIGAWRFVTMRRDINDRR